MCIRDRSLNADLFKEIYEKRDLKNLGIVVKWMPSHLKTKPEKYKIKPDWVTERDIHFNDIVDKAAERAALQHAIQDANVTTRIKQYRKLVVDIQKRLANIIMSAPDRKVLPKDKVVKEKKPDYLQIAASNGHILNQIGNELRCSECFLSFSRTHSLFTTCLLYTSDAADE